MQEIDEIVQKAQEQVLTLDQQPNCEVSKNTQRIMSVT